MLTREQIGAFAADGFVAVRGAVPAAVAEECRDLVWSELESRGVLRDDQSTWVDPVVRINCPEGGPFTTAGTMPRLWEAYDQLIGPGRWRRRQGVGGTIPVRFPSQADPGDAGWHIESSFCAAGQWRVNVGSRERGLLAIFLLTGADADSAPTRLRVGSHLDVPTVLAPAGNDGLPGHDAGVRAAAASTHRPTVLATGQAGDVFLCHPFLVHAASWPHRGRLPRMIAQPGVALLGEYSLSPGLVSRHHRSSRPSWTAWPYPAPLPHPRQGPRPVPSQLSLDGCRPPVYEADRRLLGVRRGPQGGGADERAGGSAEGRIGGWHLSGRSAPCPAWPPTL